MFGLIWGFQTQLLTALVLITIVGMWWAEKDNRKEEKYE
jgi:hypothetical protein